MPPTLPALNASGGATNIRKYSRFLLEALKNIHAYLRLINNAIAKHAILLAGVGKGVVRTISARDRCSSVSAREYTERVSRATNVL
jgi:hypothetical protein